MDGQSIKRTIAAAGAAFHAGITVLNQDVGRVHFEHLVRTDFETHSTSGAFFLIELQGYDILKVNKVSHDISYIKTRDVTQARKPQPAIPISRGRAQRISFLTPERDV